MPEASIGRTVTDTGTTLSSFKPINAKESARRLNRKMTFSEALKIANEKEGQINKLTYQGATLNEVIIAPTDSAEFEEFKQLYARSLDAQKSIISFVQSDLRVLGVFDKHRIKSDGILILKDITGTHEK